MAWTLNQMNGLLEKMRQTRNETRKQWNERFPPDSEVTADVEDMTITYGIWKTEDGIFLIVKSKNEYHPEKRIDLPQPVVDAIRSMS